MGRIDGSSCTALLFGIVSSFGGQKEAQERDASDEAIAEATIGYELQHSLRVAVAHVRGVTYRY